MKRIHFYLIYALTVLLTYAAQGVFGPIAATFLLDKGLSSEMSSTILAAAPLFIIVLVPSIGKLASRTGMIGKLCEIELVFAAVCNVLFLFTPSAILLFVLYGVTVSLLQSVFTLLDIIMLQSQFRYDSLRIWASLGYAVAAQSAGVLYDKVSYAAVYGLNFFVLLASAFLIKTIQKYDRTNPKRRVVNQKSCSLRDIVKNKTYLQVLFFSFFIMGIFVSQEAFSPMLFREVGGTAAQVGLYQLLLTLFEIPIFLAADHILRRVSWLWIAAVCSFFSTVTYFWYALLPEPGLLIAAFWVKGASFSLFVFASVKTIKEVVAEDALSFAMAVQNMAAKGVCALIISLAGGKIIGLFGIRSFYGVISLMSLAVFLAAVFLLVVFAKKSYRTKTTRSDHT